MVWECWLGYKTNLGWRGHAFKPWCPISLQWSSLLQFLSSVFSGFVVWLNRGFLCLLLDLHWGSHTVRYWCKQCWGPGMVNQHNICPLLCLPCLPCRQLLGCLTEVILLVSLECENQHSNSASVLLREAPASPLHWLINSGCLECLCLPILRWPPSPTMHYWKGVCFFSHPFFISWQTDSWDLGQVPNKWHFEEVIFQSIIDDRFLNFVFSPWTRALKHFIVLSFFRALFHKLEFLNAHMVQMLAATSLTDAGDTHKTADFII